MDEITCYHDKRFKGVLFTTNGCLACELEKMISENDRLGEKIKELEEGIAIAYDYLKSKYIMDSVPLNKVSELYKLIDK